MTTATANATASYPAPNIDAAIARALAAVRDRPDPEFDAGCSPQKYAGMAQNFRASAHHGRIIHNHRALWQVVRELAQLVGDAGDMETRNWIINSFHVARGLHSNFYEGRYSEHEVIAGLILCEDLSERLYGLFGPNGHSP